MQQPHYGTIHTELNQNCVLSERWRSRFLLCLFCCFSLSSHGYVLSYKQELAHAHTRCFLLLIPYASHTYIVHNGKISSDQRATCSHMHVGVCVELYIVVGRFGVFSSLLRTFLLRWSICDMLLKPVFCARRSVVLSILAFLMSFSIAFHRQHSTEAPPSFRFIYNAFW